MKPTAFIIQSRHKLKRAILLIPTNRKSALARRKTYFGLTAYVFLFFEIILIYFFWSDGKKPQLSINLF